MASLSLDVEQLRDGLKLVFVRLKHGQGDLVLPGLRRVQKQSRWFDLECFGDSHQHGHGGEAASRLEVRKSRPLHPLVQVRLKIDLVPPAFVPQFPDALRQAPSDRLLGLGAALSHLGA